MRLAALALGAAASAGSAHADGAALFAETCAACHGEAGVGVPGLAPPLARPAFWAGLGDKAPTYLAGVMAAGLSGKLTVDGQLYIGLVMPPQSAVDPAALAEIGTYVLTTLGGTSGALSAEAVATARATPPAVADLRALRSEG